jgi:hypothetical protein
MAPFPSCVLPVLAASFLSSAAVVCYEQVEGRCCRSTNVICNEDGVGATWACPQTSSTPNGFPVLQIKESPTGPWGGIGHSTVLYLVGTCTITKRTCAEEFNGCIKVVPNISVECFSVGTLPTCSNW